MLKATTVSTAEPFELLTDASVRFSFSSVNMVCGTPPPHDRFWSNRSLEPTLAGEDPEGAGGGRLLGGALGENPLQRAAVHVEAPCRFGDIAAAQFIDALDVLPPHAVGRHRICGRFGLLARGGGKAPRDR